MSEYMREKKRSDRAAEQEKQLMKALYKLIETYPNYEKPYLRKDGDIVIPLDTILKQIGRHSAAWQLFFLNL